MYPSYQHAPELSQLHQAEIRALREEIRQARLLQSERESGEPPSPSLWRKICRSASRVPRLIIGPRPV